MIPTAFASPIVLEVSDTRLPNHDTVTVTVHVGNGAGQNDPSGLVIDTETIVLREAGETTGVFRSYAVQVASTVEFARAANGRVSWTRGDTVDVVSIYEGEDVWLHWSGSHYGFRVVDTGPYLPMTPVIHDHPDAAKVPIEARFAEVNTSLIVWAVASLLACWLFWILIRRLRPVEAAKGIETISKEDIPKLDLDVLVGFLKRHPDHTAADVIAGEIGRRYFDRQDYERAADYLEMAVKRGRDAKNPEAHFYLGHACRQLGYTCDAIDEWMACYMDDPEGPLAKEAFREAQRWRAFQVVKDKVPCPECGANCRLIDFHCSQCKADLHRTLVTCGVCGKSMIKEAQLCIHCLPDEIKAEVAEGSAWPVVKTTGLDWEAKLLQDKLAAEDIPSVLTGEKGSAIPLTIGYLGEIHIRVPVACVAEARAIVQSDAPPEVIQTAADHPQEADRHARESGHPDAFVRENPEELDSRLRGNDTEITSPHRLSYLTYSPLVWILLGFCILMSAWFFYIMGGWTVISTVDGEKIRERDISVSIHESVDLVTGPPKGSSGMVRQTMARNMEKDRLRHLEAKILRQHLIAKGTSDQQQLKLDDNALVQWGMASGRIKRPVQRPRR
ncbi:hypothetical protein HY522_03605 [bacterium]|nr:hypothetical protein [bacterium]